MSGEQKRKDDTLIIDINTVNKSKLESVREVAEKETIFREVYTKAEWLVRDIMKNNESMKEKNENMRYNDPACLDTDNDEQVPNVIAFLGERGRGKTSAMLSFLFYQKELQKKPNEKYRSGWNKDTKVLILPYIDAATLAEREFVLDVILAKMWDGFEDYRKSTFNSKKDVHFIHLERSVQEQFVKVRKAYLVLKEKEDGRLGKQSDKDEPVAGALHELAVSMNLRQELQKLVQDYTRFLDYDEQTEKKGYLMLAIDDIDMSGRRAQQILEQIRRFLSIPGIIIFMTADIDRLKQMCESRYIDIYKPLEDMETLYAYANDYLEKVLPSNMRIYMPELNLDHNKIILKKDAFEHWEPKLVNRDEKGLILEIMAERCGIYFDVCRNRRHFLQNTSLRLLANYFQSLSQIKDAEIYSWLKSDLKDRLIQRVKNSRHRTFLTDLLKRDYERMNSTLISYFDWEFFEEGITGEKSLGKVLYLCGKLEEADEENTEMVNCILYLYSIIFAQVSNGGLIDKIVGNSLFDNWEYGVLSSDDTIKPMIQGFEKRCELILYMEGQAKGAIAQKRAIHALKAVIEYNKAKIQAWACTMLYAELSDTYDILVETDEIPDQSGNKEEPKGSLHDGQEGGPDAKEVRKSMEPVFRVHLEATARKSYFGFMRKNRNERDRIKAILIGMLRELAKKIYKLTGQDYEERLVEQTIQSKGKRMLQRIFAGRADTKPFPVKNVEILYSIGKALDEDAAEDSSNNSAEDFIFEKMKRKYQIIERELARRDAEFKKMQIDTFYRDDFVHNVQVKIFMDPDFMEKDVKEQFILFFADMCKDASTPLLVRKS